MLLPSFAMSQLVPCPGCSRHVRFEEPACPFCGDRSPRPAPRRVTPLARRSRAAILGATLVTTTAAAGCYDDHGRGADTGVRADAHVTPDAATPSVPDTGALISAYGTPFPDDAALDEPDAGAPAAEYGGPPLWDDAGVDADMGDPGADYGSPPSD